MFRPIADGTLKGGLDFVDAFVRGLWLYADEKKQAGKAHHLSANMIKLIERMLRRCTDFATGRCEPSIDHIMKITLFSRKTAISLLARARAAGFLSWARRTEPTGNKPGEGPVVKQTTNAYYFELSRMPVEMQRHLKQELPDTLKEYPDRICSGKVPNKIMRATRKMVLQATTALATTKRPAPADTSALDARLEAAPRIEWPAILFPADPEAAREYARTIGFPDYPNASVDRALQSPP